MKSSQMVDSGFNNLKARFFGFNQQFRGNKRTAFSFKLGNGVDYFFIDQLKSTINVFDIKTKKNKDCQLPKFRAPNTINRYFTAKIIAYNHICGRFFLGTN